MFLYRYSAYAENAYMWRLSSTCQPSPAQLGRAQVVKPAGWNFRPLWLIMFWNVLRQLVNYSDTG